MDLRQLEYIVKIAEEQSITRAAEKLYITQSALNQQLLKLEGDLGIRLFTRGKNECTPTRAGEIYLRGAREILAIRHRIYNEISDLMEARKSHISIGFTPNRGIDMFIQVYPEFHRKYPEIYVEPREMSVRRQLEEIAADRLDIGFMTLAREQKTKDQYITLAEEEFYVIIPAAHPQAAKCRPWGEPAAEISLELLKNDPFVLLYKESTSRKLVDSRFEEEAVVPKILFDTASNKAIIQMVQTGQCCGVVPGYYLRDRPKGICAFSFRKHLTWEVTACYKKSGYLSGPTADFIRMAKDCWGYS